MNNEDIKRSMNTRLSDFKMNNETLRIVAFVCCLIIFFVL